MKNGWTKLLLVFVSLAALLTIGTTGYMVLESMSFVDALFLAVITLSTVGFGTLKELSTPGKLFTIGLIVVGVATFSYHLSQLFRILVEKGFVEVMERRRMNRKIEELEDHYIICGHGRIGSVVTGELQRSKRPLVVVESSPQVVEGLQGSGVLALQADALDQGSLKQAGVQRAKGLIALLPSDADNLYLILTARELNPTITIIARANDLSAERRLQQVGATHVISPHREGGKRIARMILNPAVTDFIEMATEKENLHLQMEEVLVRPASPLAAKSLNETSLLKTHRILVVAIKRSDGTMTFNPEGSTRIEAGDALIVLGQSIQPDLF